MESCNFFGSRSGSSSRSTNEPSANNTNYTVEQYIQAQVITHPDRQTVEKGGTFCDVCQEFVEPKTGTYLSICNGEHILHICPVCKNVRQKLKAKQ